MTSNNMANERDTLCSAEAGSVNSPLPPTYNDIPGIVPLGGCTPNDAPPSYEEANNMTENPPSYSSLFGQVREAHRASIGFIDFLRKLIQIFLKTIGCTIVICVTVIIPLSMIYIGSFYLQECPTEHYIPIFLLVEGVFGVLKNLFWLWRQYEDNNNNRNNNNTEEEKNQSVFESMIDCFLVIWFIIGSIWIYNSYEPNYDDITSEFYCNKILYQFGFWLITSIYICLSLLVCCFCVVLGWSVSTK